MAGDSFPLDSDLQVVTSEPLLGGISGSKVERLTLQDGRSVIRKTLDPDADWLMLATQDRGRAATLIADGVLTQLPNAVDHAVMRVSKRGSQWHIYLRDVTDALLSDTDLAFAEHCGIVDRMTGWHIKFRDDRRLPNRLCRLEDRLRLFAPTPIRGEWLNLAPESTHVRGRGGQTWSLSAATDRGWELLAERPRASQIFDSILRVLADPRVVLDLVTGPPTLVHGDIQPDNLAIRDGCLIVLDWGSLACHGSAAIDFADYLLSASMPSEMRDGLIDHYMSATGNTWAPATSKRLFS